MKLLEDKIRTDGVVRAGNILKVDSFLNHQIDPFLLREIAKEFNRIFGGLPLTKILTIEASGIAIAAACAMEMGIPLVFAKKAQSKNLDGKVYTTPVHSYTHGRDYDIMVSHRFLGPEDHVLVIDDFLAMGSALDGLLEVVNQSGAICEGVGIVIEKGFQPGGKMLRDTGVNLHSLAIIDSMDESGIVFRPQPV